MITRLASYFSVFIGNILNYDEDDTEVLVYGLECILNTLITTILIVIFGFVSGHLTFCIIWIVFFPVLRSKIGGYHAPKHYLCIISSTSLCIISVLLSVNFRNNLELILCTISIIIPYTLKHAPLSPKDKLPINDSSRKKIKLQALILVITGFSISLLLLYWGFMHISLLITIIIISVFALSVFELHRNQGVEI